MDIDGIKTKLDAVSHLLHSGTATKNRCEVLPTLSTQVRSSTSQTATQRLAGGELRAESDLQFEGEPSFFKHTESLIHTLGDDLATNGELYHVKKALSSRTKIDQQAVTATSVPRTLWQSLGIAPRSSLNADIVSKVIQITNSEYTVRCHLSTLTLSSQALRQRIDSLKDSPSLILCHLPNYVRTCFSRRTKSP